MPTAGVRVLFIGKKWDVPYDVQVCNKPTDILGHIARFMPDVIFSSDYVPGVLKLASFELRKRWIHIPHDMPVEEVIRIVEGCYFFNIWSKHQYQDDNPLVSVYTGTYNTGDVLLETYMSLREQTYPTWEWVVVDDESTDKTWEKLLSYAQEDHRVRPMRIKHNGKIGAIKDLATRMAYGEYVCELDHDDMLTDTALAELVQAFKDPDVSMVYSNAACFYPDGTPQEFNDEFWTPRYRTTEYRGKQYRECLNPEIYGRSGPWHQHQWAFALLYGPNHFRAYRTELLRKLGGYNRHLPVADDLDVYQRFFLHGSTPEEGFPKGTTRCVHLNKMLYLYRFHDGYNNTTFTRNKSIQDHVGLCQKHRDLAFQEMNMRRERATLANASKEHAKIVESLQPDVNPAAWAKASAQAGAKAVPISPEWSVVVLDWNTENTTINCLRSVRGACPNAEIILVENGRHFDCELADKVIKLETNIGFAGGCNRGAMEATGTHILFLNSDAMVSANNFKAFEKAFENPKVAAAGPYSNQAKPPQGNHPNGYGIGQDLEVEMLSAFCLAVFRPAFEKIGGFDTQFCNFEDDDLCHRLRAAGYKLILADTWVLHHEHTSFKANEISAEFRIEQSRQLYNTKYNRYVKVVAITLNEINALPGFFDQFRHITNDFSILDSGSTDGTIEWAKKNGVKVFKRPFDNFANQRNAALEFVGKDGGWVIMHDPDERLDQNTLEHLHVLTSNKDFDIFLLPLDALNYDGTRTNWVAKPFLFRNTEQIKWVNPVHEKLIGSMKQAMVKNGMNTHVVSLHDKGRRSEMAKLYDSLGSDAALDPQWPILNYQHRDDDRIKKVFLGPVVSVVIPTYKRRELLARAVRSVQDQDYLNTEIVIVGDCDPDFVEYNGCRCLNLPKNHGAGGAEPRNYGIYLSSGPYIAYCDDDNALRSDHISSLVCALEQHKADFAFASLDLNGKTLPCKEPVKGQIDTSSVLHKKTLAQTCGLWRDRVADGYAHDFAFFDRFVKGGAKWVATGLPTVIYNIETSGQVEFLTNIAKGLK